MVSIFLGLLLIIISIKVKIGTFFTVALYLILSPILLFIFSSLPAKAEVILILLFPFILLLLYPVIHLVRNKLIKPLWIMKMTYHYLIKDMKKLNNIINRKIIKKAMNNAVIDFYTVDDSSLSLEIWGVYESPEAVFFYENKDTIPKDGLNTSCDSGVIRGDKYTPIQENKIINEFEFKDIPLTHYNNNYQKTGNSERQSWSKMIKHYVDGEYIGYSRPRFSNNRTDNYDDHGNYTGYTIHNDKRSIFPNMQHYDKDGNEI